MASLRSPISPRSPISLSPLTPSAQSHFAGANSFEIDLPRDTAGQPLKETPAGLWSGIEAFKHAKSLIEMSRFYDSDFEKEMMTSAGFDLVADKLRSAAWKTEGMNPPPVGEVYDVNGGPLTLNISLVGQNVSLQPAIQTVIEKKTHSRHSSLTHLEDPKRTEWYTNALVWSWSLRENGEIPELDDAEGWLRLMKRPNAAWSVVWAAYCVAQVQAASMAQGIKSPI